MKRLLKSALVSIMAVAPVLFSAHMASAQTATNPTRGMDGSYVGAGLSAGVTSSDNTDSAFGGNVQGRLNIPRTPVSVRGAVLFGGETAAIIPTLTYDAPVARNTNVYVGAGYSFIDRNGKSTQLGDKDAPVLTVGAETAVQDHIVLYGDTKLAIDAYRDSNSPALSFQAGAAYRF